MYVQESKLPNLVLRSYVSTLLSHVVLSWSKVIIKIRSSGALYTFSWTLGWRRSSEKLSFRFTKIHFFFSSIFLLFPILQWEPVMVKTTWFLSDEFLPDLPYVCVIFFTYKAINDHIISGLPLLNIKPLHVKKSKIKTFLFIYTKGKSPGFKTGIFSSWLVSENSFLFLSRALKPLW